MRAAPVCNSAAYPNGPGPNPNALAYFKSLPAANGNSLGRRPQLRLLHLLLSSSVTLNTSIVRLDYSPPSKHRIFARGQPAERHARRHVEQFPGQPAASVLIDNSKGMIFGDTWTITSQLVNDIRYGYIRQGYGNAGVGHGRLCRFPLPGYATAETRTTNVSVPVNNVVDNFTIWSKGNHTFGLGGNWRLVHITAPPTTRLLQ